MLTLDLKPIFTARGITKPYSFLMKNGFSHNKAQSLASGTVKTIHISYIEKLCTLLWCTPNDLFLWEPQQHSTVPDDHPLRPLSVRPVINISRDISRVPLDKLEALNVILKKEMERKGD